MAKKTTQKKTAKAGVKKKTPSAKSKKAAAKPAGKKTASKPAAKKASVKKKPAVKKKTAKKPAVKKKAPSKKAAATKSKAPAKKPARKKTAPLNADPANNGKSAAAAAKTASPPIRRVVRPTPLPAAEPEIEDWTPLSDAKLRKVKTDLSRKDLGEFKNLLLEKRAQIVGDVLNMEEARSAGNGGDLSNMPLHMADIGSDNYEQEFTLGLVESERKLLMEIDAALMRIKNRTYGVCIITGTPIPKARLEIKPWAKYSIDVVRKREKLGLHSF